LLQYDGCKTNRWRLGFRMTAALPLHAQRYGGDATRLPLVLLHGLFGAGGNWQGIARRLAAERRVLVPDLRNHGASPHAPAMDYASLAADVGALLDAEGIAQALVAGHSLGGKVAMWLALEAPARIAALGVVDIAPVRYPPGFEALVTALAALPLADIAGREDADRRLREPIPDARVRGFLLQNLQRSEHGWRWRCNLDAIAQALPALRGFPDAAGRQFPGPAWFLYGTASAYVGQAQLPAIRTLFPLARLRAVPNAGHWVQTDQPDAFVAALRPLLRAG
jgi:esterase